jgi:hypothetical protein
MKFGQLLKKHKIPKGLSGNILELLAFFQSNQYTIGPLLKAAGISEDKNMRTSLKQLLTEI